MIRFRVASVALLACGCATTATKVVHDDNTDRIDREMTKEVFTEATPGAQGIVLGPDAPPLAVVTYADTTDYSYGRRYDGYGGYGYGPWYTGGRHGTRVSYPNLPGANGQPFGGGTAGGGPHPGSGGNFAGGTAGGSPHGGGLGGSHGGVHGGHGFGGGGHGGHR